MTAEVTPDADLCNRLQASMGTIEALLADLAWSNTRWELIAAVPVETAVMRLQTAATSRTPADTISLTEIEIRALNGDCELVRVCHIALLTQLLTLMTICLAADAQRERCVRLVLDDNFYLKLSALRLTLIDGILPHAYLQALAVLDMWHVAFVI